MLKLEGQNAAGQPTVMLWKPKAIKPFANYRFKTQSELHKYVHEVDQRISNHQKLALDWKAARKGTQEQLDAVKIGSIFCHSWGYDQTNKDFYQVVEKKGRHVVIREVCTHQTEQTTGNSMAAYVVAVPDAFKQDELPMTKLLQFQGGHPCITIESFGSCTLWDGKPEYISWYA
jgi:hypothetical protein